MSAVEAWDTRRCAPCARDRVHYRVNGRWRCIGTLPKAAYVAPCEGGDS